MRALDRIFRRRAISQAVKKLVSWKPASLFANNEQGVYFDPNNTATLFEDTAGTIPTALERPVGLMLDLSGRGNHATSSSTARPTLTRRVNLLSNTEAFANVAWGAIGVTKASTTEPSPKNTPTALKLTSTGNSNHQAYYAITTTTACILRFSVKKTTSPCFYLGFDGSKGVVYFDLINKWVSSLVSPATSPSITTNVDDQSYVDVSVQIPSGGTFIEFGFLDAVYTGTSLSPWTIPTGATEGIVWGADLRPANIGVGLPAYQRVGDTSVNAADYDTAGFPAWLRCSGGQSMVTPSINFTGTDKMTVWAGVRKLSDPAVGMITELSSSWSSNAGSFALDTEYGGPGPKYTTASRGTAAAVQAQVAEYLSSSLVAPITNIISAKNDIAGDLTTLRVDGVQRASAVADKGTGNYGNYPLYLFARNQASLFFDGLAGAIIVRGAQSSAAEIASAENWINAQQKVYQPPKLIFTALDSIGVSYPVLDASVDSSGSTYTITATVLDSAGTSYNLI